MLNIPLAQNSPQTPRECPTHYPIHDNDLDLYDRQSKQKGYKEELTTVCVPSHNTWYIHSQTLKSMTGCQNKLRHHWWRREARRSCLPLLALHRLWVALTSLFSLRTRMSIWLTSADGKDTDFGNQISIQTFGIVTPFESLGHAYKIHDRCPVSIDVYQTTTTSETDSHQRWAQARKFTRSLPRPCQRWQQGLAIVDPCKDVSELNILARTWEPWGCLDLP
jgi:hypothetical protein